MADCAQAVSPEAFYVEWLRAGQDSERMSPSQEALCAVIEAWGARFSDSPVVLGLSGSKAADAPKVWKKDGTTIPGTAARVHWGRSRLSVCNALADRAKKLIDYNGIMRRPTVTGIQALALYNLLATMTDQADRAADQYMQGELERRGCEALLTRPSRHDAFGGRRGNENVAAHVGLRRTDGHGRIAATLREQLAEDEAKVRQVDVPKCSSILGGYSGVQWSLMRCGQQVPLRRPKCEFGDGCLSLADHFIDRRRISKLQPDGSMSLTANCQTAV